MDESQGDRTCTALAEYCNVEWLRWGMLQNWDFLSLTRPGSLYLGPVSHVCKVRFARSMPLRLKYDSHIVLFTSYDLHLI